MDTWEEITMWQIKLLILDKSNELTFKDLEFFTWEKLDRVEDVKKHSDYKSSLNL